MLLRLRATNDSNKIKEKGYWIVIKVMYQRSLQQM
jgi:hypothetical protein